VKATEEAALNHPAPILTNPSQTDGDIPIHLKRMDLFPVAIPLTQPMKMAGVIIRDAENLFVRIESADGAVGWGEAASAPTMTGENLWGMAASARTIWDSIKNCDARFRPAIIHRIQNSIYGNTSAKSAVEMAILDLLGKTHGVSAGDMLGGRFRDTLEPMWMLGHATPEEDIQEALIQQANGYRFFKLKVGTKTIENDIASVVGVRNALGHGIKLCADANCGLTFASARRLIEETANARLLYLEQPLPVKSLGELGRLNQIGIVPIGIDEGIHSRQDIETHAERGAASGISLKLIKLGGLVATLECASRATELGLSINVAAKVAESSLASAAAAHAAAAIKSFDWGLSLTHIYLEHDPVHTPLHIKDGVVSPPRGSGLGIEVDEAALSSYKAMGPG
jgi:muconate cycloisomerase